MKKLENNIYYEEEGENNNELIIFLHSNLLSNWIWKNQRTSFEDYHCIYLDLPNHGNSYFRHDFSIKNSGELIKDLIEEKSSLRKINSGSKAKKVHLIGISVGGQIILYLLAKYPELIDTAIVTGVNIYENPKKESIDGTITMLNKLKSDILDKKSNKFLIKALLAEYGLGKEHYDDLKESTENIINKENVINRNKNRNKNKNKNKNKNRNENRNDNDNECEYNYNLNQITKESLKFKIPEIKSSTNDQHDYKNLLILYGTKEYPKARKSAKLIKNIFKNAQIFSLYRSIHLWNLIDYEWFNETVKDFIANKNLDLNKKPYLKKEGWLSNIT